jgi:hypothetical protein
MTTGLVAASDGDAGDRGVELVVSGVELVGLEPTTS